MSTSKLASRRRTRSAGDQSQGDDGTAPETLVIHPTVSREELLEDGSDHRFRQLVADLFTISARMNVVRQDLARRMGITAPQYSILVAIAHVEGGVGVGALANTLHVSSAFIATETSKLARRGLIQKRPNPEDRRGVLTSLTAVGRSHIERNHARIRAINDVFFGSLSREAFDAMLSASAALVRSSTTAMRQLETMDHDEYAAPDPSDS